MDLTPEARELLTEVGAGVEMYGRKIADPDSTMEDIVSMRDCLITTVSTLTTLLHAQEWYNRRW